MTHSRSTTPTNESVRVRDRTPAWYWWSLALGWVVVGVIADLDRPWATAAATFIFGTMHAAIYSSAVRWRHQGTRRLPVSVVVIGSLVILAGLTIAGTWLLAADGARHPSTIASVIVAVIVLLGGPALMSAMGSNGPTNRESTVVRWDSE